MAPMRLLSRGSRRFSDNVAISLYVKFDLLPVAVETRTSPVRERQAGHVHRSANPQRSQQVNSAASERRSIESVVFFDMSTREWTRSRPVIR